MTRDDALNTLAAIHRSLQVDVDFAALSEAIRQGWPEDFGGIFPAEQELKARPCALNARDFHLGELGDAIAAAGQAPASAALRARLQYHAKWLLFLGSPGPGTWPKVSLVVPTFNRAWSIDSLVANCLRQTYANIEIVIVNDGSTDGSLAKLRAFGDRIRLVDQENKGVSGARNAGIAAATGELIHFLDSDNLLHPAHLAEKVQAFATVPDAQHCYCRAVEVAIFGATPGVKLGNTFVADEGDISPTDDLLTYSVLQGFPFLVTASTLPRHTLLSVAPAFDEDLRRVEDARLWFRLAVAGIKTMRVGRPLFYRIRMKDGLNEGRLSDRASGAIVSVRALVDLLRTPRHWPMAVQFLTSRVNARRFEESDGVRSAIFEADFQRLLQTVAELPEIEARTSMAALPILLVLAGFGRHQQGRARLDAERWRRLSAAAAEATGKTRPWQSLNIGFWEEQRFELKYLKWFRPFLSASSSGLPRQKAAELDLVRALLQRAAIPKPPALHRFPGLVTFLVPVCDRPEQAAATIRSVLAQRMSRLARIIVVDSDRTRLSEWRRFSPGVSAFYAESFAEAHALALDARQTAFIRFLRPGDRLSSGALGRQLMRAVLDPMKVLVESDTATRAGSFGELSRQPPRPTLSRMWFPKWLIAKLGGFDVVLGNAFEERYWSRLRAGGVPLKAVPVLTQWSDIELAPDRRGMALDSVSSLIPAFRNRHLWKSIPGLFQDLARSGFTGSEAGTLLRRAFEVLNLELASLAQGADRPALLTPLALCLVGMARYGAPLPPELVGLKRAIEGIAKDRGGEDRSQSFYEGLVEDDRTRSLASAIEAAIEGTRVPSLQQELRCLKKALRAA